jgi:hypothetical protein
MRNTVTTVFTALTLAYLSAGSAQAELNLQANQAKPAMKLQATTGIPKPPTCASDFTPVGIKLVKHEGKQWYEYSCAREETIVRSCNADTDVTAVKNDIISLPSDGKNQNSKLQLSYKCFHYVPVK